MVRESFKRTKRYKTKGDVQIVMDILMQYVYTNQNSKNSTLSDLRLRHISKSKGLKVHLKIYTEGEVP